MAKFRYGPVDLIAAAFDGPDADPTVMAALRELVDAGHVRVMDAVVVRRDAHGSLSFDDPDLPEIDLLAQGIIACEDAEALVVDLAPTESATVFALELTWALTLANRMASAGGVVLDTVRIPAPVVNAVLDTVQPA